MAWKPSPKRCDCPQAVLYWQARDREEAEQEAREKEQARQSRMRQKAERLLAKSGIGRRFQRRTFENFLCDSQPRSRAYEAAKAYADAWPLHAERGEGLYIEGPNGTGKTHLAVAIALHLLAQGIPAVCKTGADLLQDIKQTFDSPGRTEREVIDVYRQVDLLVIDDLGKEQPTEWSLSALFSVLNGRYEAMRPTIITTNYGAGDLEKALTPRGGDAAKAAAIISRLRETSRVLTMDWPDCRGRGPGMAAVERST